MALFSRLFRTWVLLSLLVFGLTFIDSIQANKKSEEQLYKQKLISKLRKSTNEELKANFLLLLSDDESGFNLEREFFLSEMIRRGGRHWEQLLKVKSNHELYSGNLEFITALRRLQKKHDPVMIFLESDPNDLYFTPVQMPSLEVSLRNMDVERKKIDVRLGGDYRTGRQARWSLELVNKKGNLVHPNQSSRFYGFGGGIGGRSGLKHGESWTTVINVRDFVESPPLGEYTLQVLYHNHDRIAGEDDLTGYILCKSAKIPIVVTKVWIDQSEAIRSKVKRLLKTANYDDRLKIIDGGYGKSCFKLVPPETEKGKILNMGLSAVPTMVETLCEKGISNEKRAWIFSMLFTATGVNDPRRVRRDLIPGEYDYIETGRAVFGGTSKSSQAGGYSFGGSGTVSGRSKTKAVDQEKFSAVWKSWLKKNVEIHELK